MKEEQEVRAPSWLPCEDELDLTAGRGLAAPPGLEF